MGPFSRSRYYFLTIFLGIICIVAIPVGIGIAHHEISVFKGLVLAIFGSTALYAFHYLFILLIDKRDAIGIERGQTAIDGSSGGWRLTPAFTLFILSMIFTFLTLLVFYEGKAPAATKPASDSTELARIRLDSLILIQLTRRCDTSKLVKVDTVKALKTDTLRKRKLSSYH